MKITLKVVWRVVTNIHVQKNKRIDWQKENLVCGKWLIMTAVVQFHAICPHQRMAGNCILTQLYN